MSSLFDVPAQLAMVLSLAAAAPMQEAPAPIQPVADADGVGEPLEGPLRFGETAWLRALHDNPKAAEAHASRVFVTSGGRFYLPTAADRRLVLYARNDAPLAARVARAAAERNAVILERALDRSPTGGDLYIAHLFGTQVAIALIKCAAAEPNVDLKARFPALAPLLGPQPAGAPPMTVGQFYRRLSGAVYDPPRLIAIGLKTRPGDAARAGLASGGSTLAWQATVDLAKVERPVQ